MKEGPMIGALMIATVYDPTTTAEARRMAERFRAVFAGHRFATAAEQDAAWLAFRAGMAYQLDRGLRTEAGR